MYFFFLRSAPRLKIIFYARRATPACISLVAAGFHLYENCPRVYMLVLVQCAIAHSVQHERDSSGISGRPLSEAGLSNWMIFAINSSVYRG